MILLLYYFPNMLKVGSLFAGIGGIDIAFQNAGFQIEWANEIDTKACITYSKNFKNRDYMICDDIKNLKIDSLSKIDILTAGFPCQAFSIAGLRKGFEDNRGLVFFELLKVVERLEPRVIFLENVKNLQSHNKGETLKHIINEIESMGYKVKYKVLNTCECSEIPQNRERIYIVCFKEEKEYLSFQFPENNPSIRRLSMKDILNLEVDSSYYYTNAKSKIYNSIKEYITKHNTFYQWRRIYVRENKQNLCPTLTANMGTGGHNVPLILDNIGIRKLTPRECARLQGFPEDFIFPKEFPNSILYKQIGNSVSIPVIEKIARNILTNMSVHV